jgi:hypothetical protein
MEAAPSVLFRCRSSCRPAWAPTLAASAEAQEFVRHAVPALQADAAGAVGRRAAAGGRPRRRAADAPGVRVARDQGFADAGEEFAALVAGPRAMGQDRPTHPGMT